MTTVYLNNAFSLNMLNATPHIITSTPLDAEEASEVLGEDFENAIKYQNTANVVGSLLGHELTVPEEPKNIKLATGDELIVAQYTGPRLLAGATELPADANLEFFRVNAAPFAVSRRSIWRFWAGFGRMGHLDAVFTATDREIENAIGETVYFGEVLGKHSEIFVTLEEKHFTKISSSYASFFEALKLKTGHNPLDYLRDLDEEWDDEPSKTAPLYIV